MKLIGHVNIAISAFPKRDRNLLTLGAVLPELIFYTDKLSLSFEQIHEGGLMLYKYLKKKNPDKIDLAIGIMSHSRKYGADGFTEDYNQLEKIGFREKQIAEVSDALGIDENHARVRVHNLYSLAIDYYLVNRHPNLLSLLKEIQKYDYDELAYLLAGFSRVEKEKVKDNLKQLWKVYDITLYKSFFRLAKLWKQLAHNFPEKDTIDLEKTARLIEKIYNISKPNLDNFLEEIIVTTRRNILNAINNE